MMKLLQVLNEWTHGLDAGKDVDDIYLDSKKEFDR